MNKLKDKKGVAIELAIFMLLVVFSLCALLTSLVYSSTIKKERETELKEKRIELDRLGEDFINENLKESYEGYVYSVENDVLTVMVGENVVLTVEKDGEGKIIRWTYS